MISYKEALRIVIKCAAARASQLSVEQTALSQCGGRHSAKDYAALDDNPRFDNAAMDGFALKAADSSTAAADAPLELAVRGRLPAGAEFDGAEIPRHSCIEIMTGAKLPSFCDAVVKLEDVVQIRNRRGGAQAVTISAPVKVGENVRCLGEDFRRGDVLLRRSQKIDPQHLMALCMGGYSAIEVFGSPRACVFSTGNELVPCDAIRVEPAQIRNSSAPLMISVLERYGAKTRNLGIVKDDREAIKSAVVEALEDKPDLIISTGGVSAGRYDLVPEVLKELSLELHFHKVAVRPGKPILFGEFASLPTVFFGLPGNPIALAAGLRFFVRPYLRALHSQLSECPQRVTLSEECNKPAGLIFFQRGVREGLSVRALAGQASFMARSLLEAQGWIVGAAQPSKLEKGEMVDWYSLW